MPHREPKIRSRELGEGLRQVMRSAGLNGKQVALALGVTPSFVSMLLSGKRTTSEADLGAFLGVCRAKGSERDRLLALRREQDTPGWFQQHGTRLPQQLRTLINHEKKAVALSDFQPMVVPGLLQTVEYARALIDETGNAPPGEIAYRRILAALAETALSEGESRQLIAALATGLSADRRTIMTAPEPDRIVWHTSSYSTTNGACVQVGWRTSSYSTSNGDCVEVAPAPDRVLVRDSKDPDGPALTVPTPAWRAFLTLTR